MSTSITLSDVHFEWPDGSVALSGIDATFTDGRTGLVGDNGSGKSTLLAVIAGRLRPSAGTVAVAGEVAYLPQALTFDHDTTLADLLGVADKIAALRAITAGQSDERHFDVLADDWDVDHRAAEALSDVGLAGAPLDRRVGELSGGEAMLAAITGIRMRRCPITLLDEPTNNLDGDARRALRRLVRQWKGTLVVVSHDIALLNEMDNTAELHGGTLTTFGGPYDQWRAHVEQQQAAAVQAMRAAEQTVRVEKRQRIEAETKLARRARTARKDFVNKKAPRIAMNSWASSAQNAAGRLRANHDDRLRSARAAADAAAARVRDDDHVSLDLPDPDVPRRRRIAELHGRNRSFVVQGPERVVITGPNGVGKTTLLTRLISANSSDERPSGRLETDRVGCLPQRLDSLDEGVSAVENVQRAAPAATSAVVRNHLGRLLVRGDAVHRPVRTLSGGERFRVALAQLLLATPAHQLLILDEPTNNLDITTAEHLVEALESYRGALLVVSHDEHFVRRLNPALILALDAAGNLTPTDLDNQRHTRAHIDKPRGTRRFRPPT